MPHTIEEAYEIADAVERGDVDHVRDELGDLLFQVVFQSRIAEEQGLFRFDDVVDAISNKLERRHPHVFGDATIGSAAEQTAAWEEHKAAERRAKGGAAGALDGVTLGLPALVRAAKLGRRAAQVGFDWPDAAGVLDKVREEIDELQQAVATGKSAHVREELGDLLFSVAQLSRHLDVDAGGSAARRERQVRKALPPHRGQPRGGRPDRGGREHGGAGGAVGTGKAGDRLKADLRAQREAVGGCLLRDRRRFAAWIERLARRADSVDPREIERLRSQMQVSSARLEERRLSLPAITYDDTLPVHARRAEIAAAIASSSVVIVSGATGSGKSTQLPKICLEMGRGVAGMIGHTQPRRIAAQALAHRVSAEIGSAPGDLVGYQVRFVDRTSPRTLVKLMTDGLLLRELESDPLLERYDTLILDEAHERNLNVDFLLGVCRQLVKKRPDLRVIVTSATIETARFAAYFDGAPVVDVEGRSFPIEVRYRPLHEEDAEAPSLPEAVAAALDELDRDGNGIEGDALVFLPGEKQISECRDLLGRSPARDWDVLPLYARLSAAEQDRIFAPHARRRVVLATNVAETSLTIPGVRFVVDSGLARISRYSPRAKFQRLPIEAVSRASADQRKGRCGRVGEGICIRLYSEEEFEARPQYTDPEILRTNLASLILQMAALRLGVPEDFPFLDAPDTRLLNDGYRLLQELSAVDGDRKITRLGRRMASLPVDPRLARILLEAGRTGCLREALVIAAFLSIQDPRERPADKTEAADEKHAQFADERSDFIAVLNLWRAAREQGDGRQPRAAALVQGELPVVRAHAGVAGPARPADRHRGGAGVDGQCRTSGRRCPAPGDPHGFPRRNRCARRRAHLPRGTRCTIRHCAGDPAAEALPALDRRRQPGRDAAPVREDGRPGPALVDRVRRGPPRPADLRRGAMGRRARDGRRPGDRVALRASAEQRAAGQLRDGGSGDRAAHLRRGSAGATAVEPPGRIPRP